MKILFVCLGNICRSPLAQGILEHKIKTNALDWVVDSAGTNGYHTGECPHKLSTKVARLNGIDISGQRARNFTADDIDDYDLIYAMAGDVMADIKRIAGTRFNENKCMMFLSEWPDASSDDVPDPWYGDEDGYHEVFELIDKTADHIVKKYSSPL